MGNRSIHFSLSLFLCLLLAAAGCRPQSRNATPAIADQQASAVPGAQVTATRSALPPVVITNEPAATETVALPPVSSPATAPTVTATSSPPAGTGEAPAATTAANPVTAEPRPDSSPSATATTAAFETIGFSGEGRSIAVHTFGSGGTDVVLVGGMHGGYEWNTTMLAYRFIDFYQSHPSYIPTPFTLHIIPNANPDGLYAVTGKDGRFEVADVKADTIPGRFNASGVDLNRNWDCLWSPTGVWRDQTVSGGTAPFSEPETVALRDYFLRVDPAVVVLWHSAADTVIAAGCPEPHQPSYDLAHIYGEAAGYPVATHFGDYVITGDASDWLSTQDIPSFTVELTTHGSLDWGQNVAGVSSLLWHLEAGLARDEE